jgi:carbamoyl-phosphate synthase large subunit
VVDLIKGDRIQLIVNTPRGQDTFFDEKAIRRAAVRRAFPRSPPLPQRRPLPKG